jgi:hypothetical protein
VAETWISKLIITERRENKTLRRKNGEGYPDPTAAEAIDEADRIPERITWFIKTVKSIAALVDLEVISRIQIRDKSTGRKYL